MQLNFKGNTAHLETGLSILCEELGIDVHNNGLPIQIIQHNGPIEISCEDGEGQIKYEKPIHFFRALGLWVEAYQAHQTFFKREFPQFEMNGVMIDVSRNAVLKVDQLHLILRKMAWMGLDTVMLYSEDTYEVKEYPYFGYMRGRYTEDELKAFDDYAYHFGIEVIPCIQTLAHLKEALKWNDTTHIRDTDDILLVGEKETYRFIKAMIHAASRPFRSSRIHIGMDEAHSLGLGKYLERNGYQDRFSIMNSHLQQVVEITEQLELKPMIWSDMYFRLGSKNGSYYDLDSIIPSSVLESIPQGLHLVYWDYYHTDQSFYEQFIEKHKSLGTEDPIFAGGVWTWNGIAPNYGLAMTTTHAALKACKNKGVKEVFATMWGDNGAETPIQSALAALQLFAEHGYNEEVDQTRLEERFHFCTGGRWEDFYLLNAFDETPGVMENNLKEAHPSKFLLWQDVLLGLYDANIEGLSLNNHYSQLAERLQTAVDRNSQWKPLFEFYLSLANTLRLKAEFGIELKQAYDEKNVKKLKTLKCELNTLLSRVDEQRCKHRKLWFLTNKPFGWEVLDIRYGGVIARLKTAEHRLESWLEGSVDKIEELEEERLYHDAPWKMPEGTLGRNAYHRIVTASGLSE
ncbi:Glycosyl hydrolase family 20, catalytic domain [Halobacillus dabanensis]|uniref:Glycosyl hydrolase family 20, catalytic domain n=1 Tax=Halobacillus dabanensis TaxID=240302 RepID=A0A1I3S225_HALDA|nr:beta-N-acetylhexosaminidase [Halobacillus dabanensis]SFJ51576.1 Glycosyl hydrolase family 20, catalytic domain [Halobacillus dabanensis]